MSIVVRDRSGPGGPPGGATVIAGRRSSGTGGRARPRTYPRRLPEILATLGLFVISFGQASGRIVVDTKLDLAVNPGGFLASATRLWDPLSYFGSVQNQAFGYLFPMGPFYWVGHTLGVPAWIVERTWLGLLFATAMWGTILLAEELGIGGKWSRLWGGVAYALSPIMLTAALASAGLLPAVLLPLVMLPLVRAAHGKTTLAGAAARSGVAVLFMGGVNATSVLAVLPLPLIWFATRRASPARTRLFLYWLAGVVLAMAWFLLALLFQGKYGFDFIPYTETAAETTKLASIPESLRGAGVWLSLVTINGQWTPAGYLFETLPVTILGTAVVAGAGLYGLVRRDLPERLFLVLSVALSTVLICAGYWGHLGGPFSGAVHILFFGPLAALRNVYKFQPVLTLPLMLGLIHAVQTWGSAARAAVVRHKGAAVGGLTALGALIMLLATLPAFTGNLYPQGSFTAMPGYWNQTTNWLNARGGLSTTLVIPGAAFGRFSWGTTNDQPIQPLTSVPWGNRNIAPLGSIGNTQFLDALDQVLVNGQPVPGLAEYLASAGVRYLLVENDLNTTQTSSPPPVVVRTVLAGEAGITRVAQFGPVVKNTDSGPDAEIDYDPARVTAGLHALEIYQVAPTGTGNSMVTTYPAGTGVVLTGGPQGMLPLAGTGQVGNQAVALAGDPLAPRFSDPTWVATDAQQLRDTDFGQLYNDVSYVLQPGEQAPTVGGTPQEWVVVPGTSHQTVSVLHGAATISASSYGTPVDRIPGYQPLGAFIDNPETASWVASGTNLHDPWIQITFDHPVPVSKISVTPLRDGPWRPVIQQVKVSTSAGQVTSNVAPVATSQTVAAAPGDTTFVRVTITRTKTATESAADAGPGFLHIAVPGVTVSQSWKVPADGTPGPGTTPTFLFSSPLPNQFAYLSAPDQEPHMSRVFSVPAAATFHVTAAITPRPSPLLMGLFNTTGSLQIQATSTFGNLPLYRPQNLVDGNVFTSWWAGAGDTSPQLLYSWPLAQTVSSLVYEPNAAASRPEVVRLSTPYKSELVKLPAGGGTVTFPPLDTNKISVTFPVIKKLSGYNVLTKGDTALPLGLAELQFPAVAASYPTHQLNLATPYTLACGQGPTVTVDGTAYRTSVTGTYAQLVSLQPMTVTLCTPGNELTVGPGTHTLTVDDATFGMKVTRISLLGSPLPQSSPPRQVTVSTWGTEQRSVRVSAGPRAIVGIHQNYNSGWTASVNGTRLQAVRLAGWQQGYVLPASTVPETVSLTFTPGKPFRDALILGAVLAVALVIWAVIPNRRRRSRRRRGRGGDAGGGSGGPGGGGPGGGGPGSPPGRAAHRAGRPTRRNDGTTVLLPAGGPGTGALVSRSGYAGRPWVAGLVLTAGLFLLAGPAAAVVPLLVSLPRLDRPGRQRFAVLGSDRTLVVSSGRPSISLPWLAMGAEVVAGVVIAVRPGLSYNALFGSLSFPAQLLGGIALGALVISLVPDLPRWQRAGGDSAPPAWRPDLPPAPAGPALGTGAAARPVVPAAVTVAVPVPPPPLPPPTPSGRDGAPRW